MKECKKTASVMLGTLLIGSALTIGCERKEPIVDINSPGADVHVDRDVDSGEIEVDIDDK